MWIDLYMKIQFLSKFYLRIGGGSRLYTSIFDKLKLRILSQKNRCKIFFKHIIITNSKETEI